MRYGSPSIASVVGADRRGRHRGTAAVPAISALRDGVVGNRRRARAWRKSRGRRRAFASRPCSRSTPTPTTSRRCTPSRAPYLAQPHDYVLFSYHGLPERHMRKADSSRAHCLTVPDCCNTCSPAHATCYRAQCFATTRAFVARAGIPRRETLGLVSIASEGRTLALALHRLRIRAAARRPA